VRGTARGSILSNATEGLLVVQKLLELMKLIKLSAKGSLERDGLMKGLKKMEG